jgi:hypothetical protein
MSISLTNTLAISNTFLRILFAILTNYLTKLVTPYGSVVIRSKPRGVINPVKSRNFSTSST